MRQNNFSYQAETYIIKINKTIKINTGVAINVNNLIQQLRILSANAVFVIIPKIEQIPEVNHKMT